MEETFIQHGQPERIANSDSTLERGAVQFAAMQSASIYGLMAEFETPEELLAASSATKNAGFRKFDTFTPFPMEGLSDAMGFNDMRVPWITLAAGVCGCLGGFSFVAWAVTQAYVFNIGGRPLYSWPQWIVPTFEMTILSSALIGISAMIALNGLPQPYHPVFNAPGFERASTDRFFLCIESDDTQFDRSSTRSFLEGLNPLTVSEVEN